MVVLGVDPGSLHTGYGVVRADGADLEVIEYDVMHFRHDAAHVLRLKQIFERIGDVIARVLPDEVAVEMPVYGRNPQSILKLGRAQAAATLAALIREIPVSEYTPKEVKKSVTGNGNASKQQVWFMIRQQLGLSEDRGTDASDALAVAVCHVQRRLAHASSGRSASWKAFLAANPDRIIED